MMRRTAASKILAGGFTVALLGAAVLTAPSALADEIPVGGDGAIDLTLEVAAAGELSMTVDTATPVALVETGDPAADNRTFTGALPTVTVTDTRTDIPVDASWGVVGQVGDFESTVDPTVTIPGEYLGWSPNLLTEVDPDAIPAVAAGDEVVSTAENGEGLAKGMDFLVWAFKSGEAQDLSTEYQADAELALIAPADEIESGTYQATLTLSLFEG